MAGWAVQDWFVAKVTAASFLCRDHHPGKGGCPAQESRAVAHWLSGGWGSPRAPSCGAVCSPLQAFPALSFSGTLT